MVKVPITSEPEGKGQSIGYATLEVKASGPEAGALSDAIGDVSLVSGGIVGAAASLLAAEPSWGLFAFALGLIGKAAFSTESKRESRRAKTLDYVGNLTLAVLAATGGLAYALDADLLGAFILALVVGLVTKGACGLAVYKGSIDKYPVSVSSVEDVLLIVFAVAALTLFYLEPRIPSLEAFAVSAPSLVKALPSLGSNSAGGGSGGSKLHLTVEFCPQHVPPAAAISSPEERQ